MRAQSVECGLWFVDTVKNIVKVHCLVDNIEEIGRSDANIDWYFMSLDEDLDWADWLTDIKSAFELFWTLF